MRENLVIGAGISGAVMAHLLATKLNEKVLVVDKRIHIAGNCFDYKDKNDIMVHKYGSHIFHTSSEKVWNFINQFGKFNQYAHKVLANIDGVEANIPFNINTLYKVFPKSLASKLETKLLKRYEYDSKVSISDFLTQKDDDLKFLAEYIYEKVFLGYTIKQWGFSPKELNKSITSRVPVYISKDDRYFQDKYQGIPLKGYTSLIESMLKHPNIDIKTDTDYKNIDLSGFKRILCTGSIDEFFDYKYGELPYRSLRFEFEDYEQEFYQSNSVINYPCSFDFTRIHEFKYYLNDSSTHTVIAKEYSEAFERGKNARFYPIPNESNEELYLKYKKEAENDKNVYFFGRLGDYKYYNIDNAILRAIELFEEISS